MIELLTQRELYELTLFKQPKKQAEILKEWGIPHVLGRDGRLRVLREHLTILVGSRPSLRKEEPNLDGLSRK